MRTYVACKTNATPARTIQIYSLGDKTPRKYANVRPQEENLFSPGFAIFFCFYLGRSFAIPAAAHVFVRNIRAYTFRGSGKIDRFYAYERV